MAKPLQRLFAEFEDRMAGRDTSDTELSPRRWPPRADVVKVMTDLVDVESIEAEAADE
jgi:hypothetical protein